MFKKLFAITVVSTLASTILISPSQAITPSTPTKALVTPAWLTTNLKDPNLVLIHVGDNDRSIYARGHIEGAQFIDWKTELANSSESKLRNGVVTRANFFNGGVAEVVILNTANKAARDATYCYLRNKYFNGDQDVENALDRDQDGIAGEPIVLDQELFAFPNPADELLDIEAIIPAGGYVRVSLHDAIGRDVMTVFEGEVPNNAQLPLQANVRDLPSGAYVLRVVGTNDQHMQIPVVIRH